MRAAKIAVATAALAAVGAPAVAAPPVLPTPTGKYGANGAVVVNKEVGYALLKKHSIIGPKEAGEIKKITYGFGVSRNSKQGKLIFERMTVALAALQQRGDVLDTLRFYGLKATQ